MQVLSWWTPKQNQPTLCTYNQRAKAKSFMAQESQVSSGLLLPLQWCVGLECWLHNIRSQSIKSTKSKHQIKHSLGEHIGLGSLMKLCPTLGSCPHSISKRTDSHKEGEEVVSSSAPGGFVLHLGPSQGGREQHFSPAWHLFQLCTHLCF